MCTCLQQTFSLGKGGKGKTECSSKGQSPWSDLIAGSDKYPWIEIDILTSSALYLHKEEKFFLMRFYNIQTKKNLEKIQKLLNQQGLKPLYSALEREWWYWCKKNTSHHLRHTLEIECSWHYLRLTEWEIVQTPCKARFKTMWEAIYPASSVFLPQALEIIPMYQESQTSSPHQTHTLLQSCTLNSSIMLAPRLLCSEGHTLCPYKFFFFFAPNRFSWTIWDWCYVQNTAYRSTKGALITQVQVDMQYAYSFRYKCKW